MKIENKIKTLILFAIVLGILSFPLSTKTAKAIFGIPGTEINFSITLKDLAKKAEDFKKRFGKFGEIAFQALRKRYITMLQNDIVNSIQNGGKPRFIQHPVDFLKQGAYQTAAQQIDELFSKKGVDICSPFKVNVRFLVSRVNLLPETEARCTLGDMKKNLTKFADSFDEGGGWKAWLQLHETNNTLPGSYLAARQIIGTNVAFKSNTLTAVISAGKGFLDKKLCSEVKYPKYNLGFTENDGTEIEIALEELQVEALLSIDQKTGAYDYDWPEVWAKINPSYSLDVIKNETIHLVSTGEFYGPYPLNPPRETPPGGNCTQEETVTPGSIIGDQLSGVLKATGIDNLINATELSQLLNAVVDAMVNRVTREGLSKVKTGPGSYTIPSKSGGGFYANQGSNNSQNLGLESPEAVALLNHIISFQDKAQKVINLNNSLTDRGGEDQAGKFKKNLTDNIGYFVNGGNGLPGDFHSGQSKDEHVDDAIDHIYGVDNDKLNKETNNPGPYTANKVFNELISEKWGRIADALSHLNNLLLDKCTMTDIRFRTEPKQEAVPFTDKIGRVFTWKSNLGDKYPYYYNLLSQDGASTVTGEIWKASVLPSITAQATSLKNSYNNAAKNYDHLIENAKALSVTFQKDLEEVGPLGAPVNLYASIMLDYDDTAQKKGAVGAIQNYATALAEGDDIAIYATREATLTAQLNTRENWLQTQIDTENNLASSPSDVAKAKQKESIISLAISKIDASIRKMVHDSPDLDDSILPPPADWKAGVDAWKSTRKTEILTSMKMDEVLGLLNGLESIDFTKNGASPSQAVALSIQEMFRNPDLAIFPGQAPNPEFEFDIKKINNTLDEKENRLSDYETEITNSVGSFEPSFQGEIDIKEARKKMGISGGDSEWEKYYKNRFQLGYAAFILDFYEKHLGNNVTPYTSNFSFSDVSACRK